MKRIYIILIIININSMFLFGQDDLLVGAFGGYGKNVFKGEIIGMDGSKYCDIFENSESNSPIYGIKLFKRISNDLNLSSSLYFQNRGSEFIKRTVFPILNNSNNLDYLETELKLETTVNTLNLNLFLNIDLNNYGLSFFAGPSVSLPLSSLFSESETIIKPDYVVFENEAKKKNIFKGAMDIINSPQYYVSCGFDLIYSLSNTIKLNPHIEYNHPINSFSNNSEIKLYNLSASLGLLFNIDRNNFTEITSTDGCRCKFIEDGLLDGFSIGPAGLIPFALGLKMEYRVNNWGFNLSSQYIPEVGKYDDTPPPAELAKENYSTEVFAAIVYHIPTFCSLQPFIGIFGGVSFRHFDKPILNPNDIQSGNFIANYFGGGLGLKFYFSERVYLEEALGIGVKSAHHIPSKEFFAYKLYLLPWISIGYKI